MDIEANIEERVVPGPRAGHIAVRAGSFIIVWGGYDEPALPVCHCWGVGRKKYCTGRTGGSLLHARRRCRLSWLFDVDYTPTSPIACAAAGI